jgi:hypothetical protein
VAGTPITTLNSSNQSNFIPELWGARALGFLHQNAVMARLVNRNYEEEFASFGDTLNIPIFGSFSVNDKEVGKSVQLQAASSSTVPVVLNQHKEVSFIVEDVAKAQANLSLMDGYIESAIVSMADHIDTSLLLAGYATLPAANSFGNGSTSFTEANLLAARRKMNLNQVPYTNRYLVMRDYSSLLSIDRFTRADAIGNGQAIQSGLVGQLHGFSCFEDPRVFELAGSPTGIHNLCFHRDGMTLVTRPLPIPDPGTGVRGYYASMDNVGIRVLFGYNITALGHQVTLDILYGIKVIRDTHMMEIVSSN